MRPPAPGNPDRRTHRDRGEKQAQNCDEPRTKKRKKVHRESRTELQRKARDDHKNDADGGALAVTMRAEAGQGTSWGSHRRQAAVPRETNGTAACVLL